MGVMMKGDKDILTLQVKGDGPIQGITVTADSKGRVKDMSATRKLLFRQMQRENWMYPELSAMDSPGDQRYGTERTICRTGRTADW